MIWITQWLCPSRHCSIGLAWDDTLDDTQQSIETAGAAMFVLMGINNWCGICGGALTAEHGRTRFRTMEDAAPALAALQEAQLGTRRMLDRQGFSVEKLAPETERRN